MKPLQIYFDVNPSEKVRCEVLSLDGRIVKTWTSNPKNSIAKINIKELSTGLYLLKIINANKVLVQKFVKE